LAAYGPAARAAAAAPSGEKADVFVARALRDEARTGWSSVIVRFPEGADGPPLLTARRERDVRALGGYVYRRCR
jgi:hypothetical protein